MNARTGVSASKGLETRTVSVDLSLAGVMSAAQARNLAGCMARPAPNHSKVFNHRRRENFASSPDPFMPDCPLVDDGYVA